MLRFAFQDDASFIFWAQSQEKRRLYETFYEHVVSLHDEILDVICDISHTITFLSFHSRKFFFLPHIQVATISTQLLCFPKKYYVEIIPRFNIVNAAFSSRPRFFSRTACLFMLIGIILLSFGAAKGGCTKCESSSRSRYYSTKSTRNDVLLRFWLQRS